MPVTVERIPEEPILIATLSGVVDVETVQEMYRLSAELMGNYQGTIYRITVVTGLESTFGDMLGVIRNAGSGQPGSTSDPRFRPVFVGTSTWLGMVRDALRLPQFGGMNLPAFGSMEQAREYIRIQRESDQENTAT